MFRCSNVLSEATQLNARSKLFLAGFALLGSMPLIAQRPQQVPNLTVMTFKSQEPEAGAKAADMLRERLSSSYSERQLTVVPTQRVVDILEQSGFDPNDSLPRYEEISLANLLRADEYVTGSITRGMEKDAPYRVQAYLILPRSKDLPLIQPLQPVEDRRLNKAMDQVRDQLRDARKQLDGERECTGRGKSRAYDEAIEAGRKGVAAYPQATLARLCVANVQYAQFVNATNNADSAKFADSSLATIREVIAIDSLSVPALQLAADLYKFRKNDAEYLKTLLALVHGDPTNLKLIDQVVNELAASGNSKQAVPFVKELLERNPGDPQFLNTAFLVFLDAEQYADAVEVGPELIRADTGKADTLYFMRMASAYTNLDQAQKAAEVYAEASAKFPNNSSFMLMHYAALEKAGQTLQALEVLKRLVAMDPTAVTPNLLLAKSFTDQKMPDSVYSLVERADANIKRPEDRKLFGTIALQQATVALREGNTAKDRELVERAVKFATLGAKLDSTNNNLKFTIAQSSLVATQLTASENMTGKSCPAAQSAKASLDLARTNFDALTGDQTFGSVVEQMKVNVKQLTEAVDYQVKTFCK